MEELDPTAGLDAALPVAHAQTVVRGTTEEIST